MNWRYIILIFYNQRKTSIIPSYSLAYGDPYGIAIAIDPNPFGRTVISQFERA